MRLPPITSTLIDIGRPSSVVVVPAAIWSGGAQRWYSASGRCSSQSAMSTRSTGAWIVAVFLDSTSTMSVRMSVVVMFTRLVLSLVDLAFRRRIGSVPPAGDQRGVFSGFFFPAEMARASNEIDLGLG